jgi:hypothetical protein
MMPNSFTKKLRPCPLDPLGFNGGDSNLYAYTKNSPTNRTDSSGLCPVYVGHRPEVTLLPTFGPPIPLEHTFLVIGGRKDKDRQVLEGEPSEDLYPWKHPKINASVYPLIPGLDPNNPVHTDPEHSSLTTGERAQRMRKY